MLTQLMESNSENTAENANSLTEESSEKVCKDCGRALSLKTGNCYYCSEANPEDIKNLNFIMLDWQQKAASDPDLRAKERTVKVLSLLQAFLASACIALGFVPDFIQFDYPYVFFILGVLSAFSCWCFHFNSLGLVFSIVTNAAVLIFFLNLAFQSIPKLIIPAFVCGFIASFSALTLLLITLRIYKNKAVEI